MELPSRIKCQYLIHLQCYLRRPCLNQLLIYTWHIELKFHCLKTLLKLPTNSCILFCTCSKYLKFKCTIIWHLQIEIMIKDSWPLLTISKPFFLFIFFNSFWDSFCWVYYCIGLIIQCYFSFCYDSSCRKK